MSEHEKTKRQQEGNPGIDGTSSDIVEESSSTSLEGNQVVLKKNKKKKTKILDIEEVRGISDGKLEIDAEKDVKEADRLNLQDYAERLMRLDACCVEDVDWDNLLEHRPGDICRKRWTEMTRYISKNKEKSFIEQVEVLSQHYSEMTEYRK
ncbi:hypothetical protein ZIOFF_065514 [Zingiber officinale]|uniref:Myb-like domain-containing protein n=1 Tax=Zingiber officinale TaxID=94328 RepID=A0A8J5EXH1_ZINOF|nr:hypothetical protein ZIOFF_065514 [Zingiber officinale]